MIILEVSHHHHHHHLLFSHQQEKIIGNGFGLSAREER
jgi:hypothetical protein